VQTISATTKNSKKHNLKVDSSGKFQESYGTNQKTLRIHSNLHFPALWLMSYRSIVHSCPILYSPGFLGSIAFMLICHLVGDYPVHRVISPSFA